MAAALAGAGEVELLHADWAFAVPLRRREADDAFLGVPGSSLPVKRDGAIGGELSSDAVLGGFVWAVTARLALPLIR